MNQTDKITIVAGAAVTGASFFGREGELELLQSAVIAGVGSRHIVGPTRIGKTSLVEELFLRNRGAKDRLFVQINLGYCASAYDFWTTLLGEVLDRARAGGLWNDDFASYAGSLDRLPPESSEGWWRVFRSLLIKVTAAVDEAGCRIVLALDEFDAVERVFGDRSVYFQLLRSICSEPRFATSGLLLTRRRLQLLEATCPHISTFHGVFPEMTLLPFSERDMEDFYRALDRHGVGISEEGRGQLRRLTGNMPYLCGLLGEQMAAQRAETPCFGPVEIEALFRSLQPQIDRHYEDLIARLEEDGQTDFIFYLSIGARVPNLTPRDIENLIAMGILLREKQPDGTKRYCVFSRDFMTYFSLRPLRLPTWETLMAAEGRIKAIFLREYPRLGEVTYRQLMAAEGGIITAAIDRDHPELRLDWQQVRGYCQELSVHKEQPTVIDVLTLSKVISVILYTWDARFARHFGEDSWKMKLGEIRKLRNPIAHGQIEHVDPEELAVCLKYCDEVIRLEA